MIISIELTRMAAVTYKAWSHNSTAAGEAQHCCFVCYFSLCGFHGVTKQIMYPPSLFLTSKSLAEVLFTMSFAHTAWDCVVHFSMVCIGGPVSETKALLFSIRWTVT